MFFIYSPEQLLNLFTSSLILDFVANLGDLNNVIFSGS